MKTFAKISAMLLCFCIIALSFSLTSFAKTKIDVTKDVELTIEYINYIPNIPKPIKGAVFKIYRVAVYDSKTQKLSLDSQFKPFDNKITNLNNIENLDASQTQALASDLKNLITVYNIKPFDACITDSNGIVVSDFNSENDFIPGFYLISGEKYKDAEDTFITSPSLISLPYFENDESEWEYDVTIKPKFRTKALMHEYGEISVTKVWQDAGKNHPDEITVRIYANDELYQKVKLNAGNNWSYTWQNINPNLEWFVMEDFVDGYSFSSRVEGNIFVITNTSVNETVSDEPTDETSTGGGRITVPDHKENTTNRETRSRSSTPTSPRQERTTLPGDSSSKIRTKLPQTGVLWWPASISFLFGILFILVGIKTRKKDE